MPNFIDRLDEKLADEKKKEELKQTLIDKASDRERVLQDLMEKHWHTPLPQIENVERRPAFAVDGSRAVRHLANGAYLFVAQALIVGDQQGERVEATDVDVRILPGNTDAAVVERYAGLMMHRLEVRLAQEQARQMPIGSVIFLDGALYGQMTSLYPLEENADSPLPDDVRELPQTIVNIYLDLFKTCAERNLVLISIAKTSHEEAHGQVWWRNEHPKQEMPRKISDSEMIFRWTERKAGHSSPVLFGSTSTFRGGRRMLFDNVTDVPAIVSFFIRLTDFDDALRIDVPASAIGRAETIGDVKTEQLIDPAQILPVIELVQIDYGGLEVYNVLLYSVDREVRLRQEMMDQVYFGMIKSALEKNNDVEIRLDRSERRFHST